jgi:charged multivesicular body protein 4
MFSRLFGGGGNNGAKAKQQAPDLNTSIQQLRGAINQLEKREVFLQKKIEQCLAKAKQRSKARDKKGALFELKKKKQLESQLQSIQGKKLNLETQIMALEDAHLNKETLKAMKTSASAMKAAVKEADLDKADELMDDINEAIDQVQEMNEAMSQPIGAVMDDDELEAELAELEEMEADELINQMPNSKKNVIDDELAEEDEEPKVSIKNKNKMLKLMNYHKYLTKNLLLINQLIMKMLN